MIKQVLSFILVLGAFPAMACTHITIKAEDKSVIVGRTMEFGPDLNSQIKTAPADLEFTNVGPKEKPSLSWTGRYGFIYLNGFGLEMAVDGMNDQGLSFGALYLPGYTEYPEATEEQIRKGIPYYQFGFWVLSQFRNIQEVKIALKDLHVFGETLEVAQQGKVIFPLHFIINDKEGNSLVIEFVNGKMLVNDNPAGILTNSPNFDWQKTNLNNYVNLSPYSPDPITLDGFTYAATGTGSGSHGLPGDVTPPSRFVRMMFLTKTALPTNKASEALVLADHILANVYIPKGLVRGSKKKPSIETTQWTVFKDLKNNILYFKSYDYPRLRAINLNKLSLKKGAEVRQIDVALPVELAEDISDKLG